MSTFAVNLIVGPGDAKDLKRCLESYKANETFDEIVIAPTCNEKTIWDVGEEFNATIVKAPWADEEYPHGNFARARNVALDATKSDYIMWLDCDDVCMDVNQEKLHRLRDVVTDDNNKKIDVYFMSYAVVSDEDWNPVVSFFRERIFKNDKRFRWRYPCHEQFLPEIKNFQHAEFKDFYNTHMPDKPNVMSAERNVRILTHEYENKKNVTSHLKYFLARDILLLGRDSEALELYTELIDGLELHEEHIFSSCLDLLNWYAYGSMKGRPTPNDIIAENEIKAETWARMAIAFSDSYAEPFVILGDLYLRRGEVNQAAKMYSIALTKKYGRTGMQTKTYYEELPCRRLSDICFQSGDFERSLFHNKRALKQCLDSELIDKRKKILQTLVDEYDRLTGTT